MKKTTTLKKLKGEKLVKFITEDAFPDCSIKKLTSKTITITTLNVLGASIALMSLAEWSLTKIEFDLIACTIHFKKDVSGDENLTQILQRR